MKTTEITHRIHGHPVRIISKRWVAGGQVALVERLTSDETQRLADDTIHPCHRAGYRWEENVQNIEAAR